MHVFMADLLGAKRSADNNRKLMELSDKEGRTEPSHEPSKEEREGIVQETGSADGDYRPAKRTSL
jgi:hypothetical protein